MKNLEELEKKYAKLGKKIEALKIEHKYPIYCLAKSTGLIVKFTSLNGSVIVKQGDGYDVNLKILKVNFFPQHTDTEYWEQLDVCPYTGFYDGQLVRCWDEEDTHIRLLKFYDAKNSSTFNYYGGRDELSYSNYEPYEGNWAEWALEAFKTLEK